MDLEPGGRGPLARIDAELESFLRGRALALPEAGPLISEIHDLIRAGGKRLRPAFCYWGFRAAGGGGDEIYRAAAALELLHTFAIVHDDIMDGSELRRGRPTVHTRRGVEIALLVGDLALVLADAAFFEAGFPPARQVVAFDAYARMRQEVIAGQFLDFELSGRRDVSIELARKVAVLKSGRYTVAEPLAIGALLAGAPDDIVAGLKQFGEPLGEAFQLRDDLLGLFGDAEVTGKPVDSDVREGKRNILFAMTGASLAGPDRDYFLARWGAGDELSEADVERLRSLVDASGARAATEELAGKLVAEARGALDSLDIGDEPRRALRDLTRLATERRA